ncbi:DUF6907 domain-containing protein [Streptomyces chrestomyceticus]|uniref:DUF6907 domain-containing protein n=1 Tax=Streptomyces chrestomyceticus TaxID=68185 RepID=UPI00378813C3
MRENAELAIVPDAAGTARRSCPPWRLGKMSFATHNVHESAEVEGHGPQDWGRDGGSAALSASIALLQEDEDEDEDDGQAPEIWFGAAGDWCELGLAELDRVIEGLDRYTVDLRALRYRYGAVLAGTDPTNRPLEDSSSNRPVQVTAPCPGWCTYRTDDSHTMDALEERSHAGAEELVPLTLHRCGLEAVDNEVMPGEIQLVLEQYAYGSLPTVALTLEGRTTAYARLSLEEARRIASALGELTAMGETCATPSALSPLDRVAADMRTTVVEDPQLEPGSSGYALGDSDPDGMSWAFVPAGLSPELREETVRGLLADIYERRGKALWEGESAPQVVGDRAALTKATVGAAA